MVEKLERRQSFQTISWFWDAHSRGLLDLDPPYQRRSVWNQSYRTFFVETVLMRYPAPAIFVFEQIDTRGFAKYSVVDGKQRLTTIFDFASNEFPLAETFDVPRWRGKYFDDLDDDTKRSFWTYQFSVEYLPSTSERLLTDIFDRINRNVARLTPQELRHARFSGVFAQAAEDLCDAMLRELGESLPNIAAASRRQMRDVELVAQLLLMLEAGEPQSFSQEQLDEVYAARDAEWPHEQRVRVQFGEVMKTIREIFDAPIDRRARNQADFYSLFGAIASIERTDEFLNIDAMKHRLVEFFATVADERRRTNNKRALAYYEAARSASNDLRQRKTREDALRDAMLGR